MYRLTFIRFSALILFFTLLINTKSYAHEFYVSIAEVEYKANEQKIEIAIQLTAHDVEYAFEKNHLGTLKLGSSNEAQNANELLLSYFREHFKIFINGERQDLLWFGKEVLPSDELWVYFTIKTPRKVKKIKFYNNILVSTYPLQENKVIFTANAFKKSFTLNAQHLKKEIFLKDN